MNLPEPRLNKIPFFLTDLGCLGVAALIGFYAKDPFAPWPLVAIVVLVLGGGVAALLPYLSDYAADCREATARLSEELEQQIARVQAAGESLARSAAHIKAVEEAVHKSARDAEILPYRMAEKLAEFNEALAEKETEDREALERELEELRSLNSGNLKAVAEKIQKATADLSALEATTRKHLNSVRSETKSPFGAGMPPLTAHASVTAAPHEEPPTAPSPRVVTAHPFAPPFEAKSAPIVSVTTIPANSEPAVSSLSSSTSVPTEPPKIKKPRPPRKPRPEDTLLAMSETPAGTESTPSSEPVETALAEPTLSDDSDGSSDNSPKAESASSSDGATRLLTTAYIGIGNKLFIRGDGPGLSWERGVPMQFVSIGKWGWATHDAAGPVRIKLFKNDEVAALTGEVELEPGRHTEVTALF